MHRFVMSLTQRGRRLVAAAAMLGTAFTLSAMFMGAVPVVSAATITHGVTPQLTAPGGGGGGGGGSGSGGGGCSSAVGPQLTQPPCG